MTELNEVKRRNYRLASERKRAVRTLLLNMRLIRADLVRMFRSFEFMACALISFAFGLLNVLFCCIMKSPSYQPTFENDLFHMSAVVIVISAVFTSLFFGTGNSVVRNKLMVGHTRGGIYCASCAAAYLGVFIINALSMLPYFIIAPMLGAKIGELTPEELMFNVLIEVLAELAAGGVCFLITVIFSRKSICAACSLLAAFIILYIPELDGLARYSPAGQLDMLNSKMYTNAPMVLYSLALIIAVIVIGAVVFGRKDLK